MHNSLAMNGVDPQQYLFHKYLYNLRAENTSFWKLSPTLNNLVEIILAIFKQEVDLVTQEVCTLVLYDIGLVKLLQFLEHHQFS